MPYVKPTMTPGPAGTSPALEQDRMPVIKVVNGDTWTVDADLRVPGTGEPATPANCFVEFMLSETRFSCEPFWTGAWMNGIVPDEHVPGLVHIRVPGDVSAELRRGTYHFSLRVRGYLDNRTETQLNGWFDVEYEPTSDTHDIPYRRMEGCQEK